MIFLLHTYSNIQVLHYRTTAYHLISACITDFCIQHHRMVWVERDLRDHLVPTSLP